MRVHVTYIRKNLGTLFWGLIFAVVAIFVPQKSYAMSARHLLYTKDERVAAVSLAFLDPLIRNSEVSRCFEEAVSCYKGKNGKAVNPDKALGLFSFVSEYANDPKLLAGSWYYLGEMHH